MIHRKKSTVRSSLYLLAITLALFAALALVQRQEALAGKLIRLHVVANSDTAADQAVKLQVRDAVLAAIAPLTDACATQEEAAAALRQALPGIEQAANDALQQAGQAACPVAVRLCKERFPTRLYPTFSLPAGTYTSLRVELGDAAGRNWWCVVFPTLCTAAESEDLRTVATSAGLTRDEIALMTEENPRYQPEFKLLEWLTQLRALLAGN